MTEVKDLIGYVSGKLTVIEFAGHSRGTRLRTRWKCLCKCGNYKIVGTDALVSKATKSCGCIKSPPQKEYIIKLQKRLKSKCKFEDSCWIWTGNKYPFGHGQTTIKDKPLGAHRAAWIAWRGPIPKGMSVLHNCPGGKDNPACINPDHLYLGNQMQNMRDRLKKNKDSYAKGENAGHSKLSEEQAIEIKSLKGKGLTSHQLATKYGVGASAIRAIWSGRSWKHLSNKEV